MGQSKQYAWCEEEYSDNYNGYFDSVEACKEDARECGEDGPIYIGECEEMEMLWSVCVENIIEDMENNADHDIEVSDEALKELELRIDGAISGWIDDFKIGKEFFRVTNIQKVEL